MSLKRKLFCLTAYQKKEICIYHSNNSNKSQQDIANVLLQNLIFKTYKPSRLFNGLTANDR